MNLSDYPFFYELADVRIRSVVVDSIIWPSLKVLSIEKIIIIIFIVNQALRRIAR
jgi:hypothetical protein